jgi:hypothetical protein
MSKFRRWLITNDVEISWFVIGSLVTFGVTDMAQGNWLSAALCFFFAGFNYRFRNLK